MALPSNAEIDTLIYLYLNKYTYVYMYIYIRGVSGK